MLLIKNPVLCIKNRLAISDKTYLVNGAMSREVCRYVFRIC